jgi:Polysaccharide lyase
MKWKLFFLALFLLAGFSCQKAPINVYDGFESIKLSNIWTKKRMEMHSFEIQSKIVREGKSAAKITLRTGDVVEAATAKDKASERDELMETSSLFSIEGLKYEYQFSLFLPDSFPIVPTRLVIAQWKQFCPACACTNYSPILAVRYTSGKLFITLQTDSFRHTLYELNEEIRNHWLNFRFQIRFSKQTDGEVQAFLNNNEIINYKGITSYSESCGLFSKKNRYYFKMGLYRDRMSEPMSIYIDEYRKKEIIQH